MMRRKTFGALIFVVVMLFLMTSCAPGNYRWNQELTPNNTAGFWAGIWHGLIIIITFIISLFTDKVGIYEVNNSGWSYNLGFIIGLLISLGGGFKGVKTRKKKRKVKKYAWDEIGEKIEEKVHAGIMAWLDDTEKEEKEKEWKEIAEKIEAKIKRVLKEWAEKK
jgi:gas vesicle protein